MECLPEAKTPRNDKQKSKNPGFRGLGQIRPIRPYFPGLGNSILSLLSAAGEPLRADYTSWSASQGFGAECHHVRIPLQPRVAISGVCE